MACAAAVAAALPLTGSAISKLLDSNEENKTSNNMDDNKKPQVTNAMKVAAFLS